MTSEPWAKNLPEGWFSAEYMLLYTKSAGFAFPGVCYPVEAGEVACVARRRGGRPAEGTSQVCSG